MDNIVWIADCRLQMLIREYILRRVQEYTKNS